MFKAPISQISKTDRYPYFSYSAEASELGLPVGRWPDKIHVDGLGNGQPFVPLRVIRQGEDGIGAVVYKQLFGCLDLTIFND